MLDFTYVPKGIDASLKCKGFLNKSPKNIDLICTFHAFCEMIDKWNHICFLILQYFSHLSNTFTQCINQNKIIFTEMQFMQNVTDRFFFFFLNQQTTKLVWTSKLSDWCRILQHAGFDLTRRLCDDILRAFPEPRVASFGGCKLQDVTEWSRCLTSSW